MRAFPIIAALALGGCFRDVEVGPWAVDATPRGFNVACWQRGCLASEEARRSIAHAAALGASDVALVLTWYVPDQRQGTPSPHPTKSPSLDELEQAARWAREQGLRVLLKPHVDRLDGGSRTELAPEDEDGWWQAYSAFVLELARRGQALGAQTLAIGTELSGLASPARWRELIAAARERFDGHLTFAANWDRAESLPFWDALDWVGVDAYYPLATSGAATSFDLVAGWERQLARLRRLDAVRSGTLVMTEVGAPSAAPSAQERVYRAALVALRGRAGVFFWNLWDGPDGGTHAATATSCESVSAAWSSP